VEDWREGKGVKERRYRLLMTRPENNNSWNSFHQIIFVA